MILWFLLDFCQPSIPGKWLNVNLLCFALTGFVFVATVCVVYSCVSRVDFFDFMLELIQFVVNVVISQQDLLKIKLFCTWSACTLVGLFGWRLGWCGWCDRFRCCPRRKFANARNRWKTPRPPPPCMELWCRWAIEQMELTQLGTGPNWASISNLTHHDDDTDSNRMCFPLLHRPTHKATRIEGKLGKMAYSLASSANHAVKSTEWTSKRCERANWHWSVNIACFRSVENSPFSAVFYFDFICFFCCRSICFVCFSHFHVFQSHQLWQHE